MDSEIKDILAQIVAPELNFLLLEPPFQASGGLDWGLFCRQHAYCTAVLAHLLGEKLTVVRGDLTIVVRGRVRMTSVASGADHDWCIDSHGLPVDLSLNLRHQALPVTERPMICDTQNGPYRVTPNAKQKAPNVENEILYSVKRIIAKQAINVVSNPALLLHNVSAEADAELCNRIVLHVQGILANGRKALQGTRLQSGALLQLQTDFPKPKGQVLKACREAVAENK